MGVSASRNKPRGPDAEAAPGAMEVWVTIKAKTTDKRSRQVTKRRWGFNASRAGVVLGSAPHTVSSSITVDDASLSSEHARIALTETGEVAVFPSGRTYLLIGQGARSAGLFQLAKDQVIKMGACSLLVTDVCFTASALGPGSFLPPDRAARRSADASGASGSRAAASPSAPSSASAPRVTASPGSPNTVAMGSPSPAASPFPDGAASAVATPGGVAAEGGGTLGCVTTVVQAGGAVAALAHGSHPHSSPRPASPTHPLDAMCYICFEGEEDEDAALPLTAAEAAARRLNPLVPSPCLCAKRVHKQCLSRWITTKGSRVCSICKYKLPLDFTADPPYVVFQVVRHMRGLHWGGEREYVVSFRDRVSHCVTVGSGQDCDLVLPDPSLSRAHARIWCRMGAQQGAAPGAPPGPFFGIEDLMSSAGTYLKLVADRPHILPMDSPTGAQLKLGRTLLTIRVKRRRAGMGGGIGSILTAATGAAVGSAAHILSGRGIHRLDAPLPPQPQAVAAPRQSVQLVADVGAIGPPPLFFGAAPPAAAPAAGPLIAAAQGDQWGTPSGSGRFFSAADGDATGSRPNSGGGAGLLPASPAGLSALALEASPGHHQLDGTPSAFGGPSVPRFAPQRSHHAFPPQGVSASATATAAGELAGVLHRDPLTQRPSPYRLTASSLSPSAAPWEPFPAHSDAGASALAASLAAAEEGGGAAVSVAGRGVLPPPPTSFGHSGPTRALPSAPLSQQPSPFQYEPESLGPSAGRFVAPLRGLSRAGGFDSLGEAAPSPVHAAVAAYGAAGTTGDVSAITAAITAAATSGEGGDASSSSLARLEAALQSAGFVISDPRQREEALGAVLAAAADQRAPRGPAPPSEAPCHPHLPSPLAQQQRQQGSPPPADTGAPLIAAPDAGAPPRIYSGEELADVDDGGEDDSDDEDGWDPFAFEAVQDDPEAHAAMLVAGLLDAPQAAARDQQQLRRQQRHSAEGRQQQTGGGPARGTQGPGGGGGPLRR